MADTTKSFFSTSAVAFITGASKGIGRAIAIEFSRRFSEDLLLVLTGRSEEDLQETVSLIQADSSFLPSKTTVRCVVGDLQNQATIESLFERLFENINPSQYDHAILVNNAASAGDISKYVRDFGLNDVKELQDYFFLNVNCPLLLVSKFLSIFSPRNAINEKKPSRHTVVQISSKAAIFVDKCCSMYCTGKIARNTLHKIIAAEEPSVRVLSYGPGPVVTDMLHYFKEHSTADPDFFKHITSSCEKAVQPLETASVMCEILEEDNYESGAYIDFSDVVDSSKKS